FGPRALARLWRRSGYRRGLNRLVFVDLRLHWLLGRSIILFTGRRAGGNALAPLANSLSRHAQRIALEFLVCPAAVHFLHRPVSGRDDVLRLLRHRACYRPTRHAIASTRTSRAATRGTRDGVVSAD